MFRNISAFLIIAICIFSIDSNAQAPFYLTIPQIFSPDYEVERRTVFPTETVTIVEKNLCPATFNGGFLYMMMDNPDARRFANAKLVNGDVSMAWYYDIWDGWRIQFSGVAVGSDSNTRPPLPAVGKTVTISGINGSKAYLYGAGCIYSQCESSVCSANFGHVITFNLGEPPSEPLRINTSVRIAQRIFEPSVGAEIDLVTKKPFAAEVTVIVGEVPESIKDALMFVEMTVNNGNLTRSEEFKLRDIQGQNSKIFVFGSEEFAGTKEIKIQVRPKQQIIGILETRNIEPVMKIAKFHETSLSLIVAEITGCSTNLSTCFSAPNASQIYSFNEEQIPFAEKSLPISSGGLSAIGGINIQSSEFGQENSIYKDAFKIWLQKKIAFQDFGVALVGDNYFKLNNEEPFGKTLGLVMPKEQGVMFIAGSHEATLSHELIHSLDFSLFPEFEDGHSRDCEVEGVGEDISEVWTLGRIVGTEIRDGEETGNFGCSYDDGNPALTLDPISYNAAFRAILTGDVDPSVVLVGGLINSAGVVSILEIQRAEANLDRVTAHDDLLVQGLDISGNVMVSVKRPLISGYEVLEENGQTRKVVTGSSFFTATLADDGSLKKIRVIKNNKIILTEDIDRPPLNLNEIIEGLNVRSFKGSNCAATLSLALVKIEYTNYRKALLKKKLKEAKAILQLIKATLSLTLKNEVTLTNGKVLSKNEIMLIVEKEIRGL